MKLKSLDVQISEKARLKNQFVNIWAMLENVELGQRNTKLLKYLKIYYEFIFDQN